GAGDRRCHGIEADLTDSLGPERPRWLVRWYEYLLKRGHVGNAGDAIVSEVGAEWPAILEQHAFGQGVSQPLGNPALVLAFSPHGKDDGPGIGRGGVVQDRELPGLGVDFYLHRVRAEVVRARLVAVAFGILEPRWR